MFRADLRKYILCLGLALAFALLPLSLLLASSTEPCTASEGSEDVSILASGNPFSHDNLCRIRVRLGHLRRRDTIPHKVVVPKPTLRQAAHTTYNAMSGVVITAAKGTPPKAPSPGIGAELAEGGNIPDIEWSQTDDDRARIKKLPHVDSCFYCKVCIPTAAAEGKDPKLLRRLLRQNGQQPHDVEFDLPKSLKNARIPKSTDASAGQGGDDDESEYDDSGYRHPAAEGAGHNSRRALSSERREAAFQATMEGTGQESATASLRQSGRGLLETADEAIARAESESDPFYHMNGTVFDLTQIAPGQSWRKNKEHLPNCTMCWGCDNSLDMMASGSIMADSYYAHEPGGSPSWLFRARTNRTASGYAVVKTWCVPVLKAKQRGLAMCSPRKVFSQVKLLLAQQKLTEECGFDDIIPKLWIERVNGVIPGNGFHISWWGLWFDVAEGISIQNFHDAGRPRAKPEVLLDMLTSKINSTQIMRGTIFDLLFSQCDRHQQNLFITETGKVTLIDNDQVFTTAWRKCGYDSITIPVSQKFYINQLGFFYVLKYPQKDPPLTWNKVVNPMILLDYRCHTPGGTIGKNFDPKLTQCLRRLVGMTKEEIQETYGYPNLRMADAIRNRSRDLLENGFEWTLLHGQPSNQPMHRYKVPQKCCNMTYDPKKNRYNCTTPWEPTLDLPYGNAWHGGVFNGPIEKDTGVFVGGSAFT